MGASLYGYETFRLGIPASDVGMRRSSLIGVALRVAANHVEVAPTALLLDVEDGEFDAMSVRRPGTPEPVAHEAVNTLFLQEGGLCRPRCPARYCARAFVQLRGRYEKVRLR